MYNEKIPYPFSKLKQSPPDGGGREVPHGYLFALTLVEPSFRARTSFHRLRDLSEFLDPRILQPDLLETRLTHERAPARPVALISYKKINLIRNGLGNRYCNILHIALQQGSALDDANRGSKPSFNYHK